MLIFKIPDIKQAIFSTAFYSDKIIINIDIDDIKKTSFKLIYQVIGEDQKKKVAKALTTITFYDYQNKKVAKIPQQFLSSLGLKNRIILY